MSSRTPWMLLPVLALGVVGGLVYLTMRSSPPDDGVVEPARVAAIAPPRTAEPAVVVEPEPEPTWPHPGDATASFERVVAECPQRLIAMNFGERLLAIDASPASLDLVIEYASKPNRFVRLSCRWLGEDWDEVVVGRQTMPPMVGDAEQLPAVLLAPAGYDVDWYRRRIAAARHGVGDAAQVERVETSFVGGRILTRVRFDGGRIVLLGEEDRALPDDTPFPQVERVRFVAPQAADLGFRDMRRVNWATAFTSRLEQIGAKYVSAEEPIYKIHVTPDYALLTVQRPDFPGQYRDKTIDEYGDLKVREAALWDNECKRPFTLAHARSLLDEAIAASGQTREQFDERTFEVINLVCRGGEAPEFEFH